MIEFISAMQAGDLPDALLFLAEEQLDEALLDTARPWICLPVLSKPYECSLIFDASSERSAQEYSTAIRNSSVAVTTLSTLVSLSNEGMHIIIACYDFNVEKSHLPILLDLIEDMFVEEAPDLKLAG